jgi:UDP-N-acetylmuramoyl-L-alanyl-D-glutamate--2,6-diaminopimelate ligase
MMQRTVLHNDADGGLRCGAVSLREALPKGRWMREGDVCFDSCTADWRVCRPGDVFFALTTADGDGHEDAALAVEKGAAAVVAERLVPVDAPVILVKDSRSALARVCQTLAGHPSRQLRTIGITGTAGKTVTSMLLASILEAAGQTAGVMSSLGNSDSLTQAKATGDTPTAPEYADWLRRVAVAECDNAVLEISSQALAQRRVSGIGLDAAVLTNIKQDHLDEHNTARAYHKIKQRIFSLLKTGGLAVINADDHRCRNMIPKLTGPVLTYALHAEADVTASVIERCRSEQTFLLTAGSDSAPVRTRMIGDPHVSNCLAAATVGLALGLDLGTIVRGLEAVDRIPGRLERLECGQPFGVFVDAASAPETLAQAIKTVRQVTSGRVFVVCGSRGGADRNQRGLIGRVLERSCHVPVLTSDDPGHEEPLEIVHGLLDGFEKPHKARVMPDRAAAIRWALAEAQEGDAVLIAGKGDRTGQLIGRKRIKHDDREVACEWLYSQGEAEMATVGPRRFRIVG